MSESDKSTPQKENKKLVLGGLLASVAIAIWWRSELSSFLGSEAGKTAFTCLVNIGTGDCAQLWLTGMHQTNQFASVVFYGGLLAFISGLTKPQRIALVCVVSMAVGFGSFVHHLQEEQHRMNVLKQREEQSLLAKRQDQEELQKLDTTVKNLGMNMGNKKLYLSGGKYSSKPQNFFPPQP